MLNIVWVAIAAAWVAVLIPPLLRSRVENRPNSSISDFRRHLSTLQRTVPTRPGAPMRAMARPLTTTAGTRQHTSVAASRTSLSRAAARPLERHGDDSARRGQRDVDRHLDRRYVDRDDTRSHSRSYVTGQHRVIASDETAPVRRTASRPVPRVSQRELVRRRRANVLFVLALTAGVSLFLAATTHAQALWLLFAASFVALGAYCYRLVQLRNAEAHSDDYGYRTN